MALDQFTNPKISFGMGEDKPRTFSRDIGIMSSIFRTGLNQFTPVPLVNSIHKRHTEQTVQQKKRQLVSTARVSPARPNHLNQRQRH